MREQSTDKPRLLQKLETSFTTTKKSNNVKLTDPYSLLTPNTKSSINKSSLYGKEREKQDSDLRFLDNSSNNQNNTQIPRNYSTTNKFLQNNNLNTLSHNEEPIKKPTSILNWDKESVPLTTKNKYNENNNLFNHFYSNNSGVTSNTPSITGTSLSTKKQDALSKDCFNIKLQDVKNLQHHIRFLSEDNVRKMNEE